MIDLVIILQIFRHHVGYGDYAFTFCNDAIVSAFHLAADVIGGVTGGHEAGVGFFAGFISAPSGSAAACVDNVDIIAVDDFAESGGVF